MTTTDKITFAIAKRYAIAAGQPEVILISLSDFQTLVDEIPLKFPMKTHRPITYRGIRVVRSEDINEGEIIVK